MNSKETERLILQARWPEPSEELRARVLAEATALPQSIVWSDRVWFSRAWRWSMAAIVIAVLAMRAWPVSPAAGAPDPSPRALADARAIEETGRDIGLPEAFTASLAHRALTRSRPRAMTFSAPTLQFLDLEETRRD